MPTRVDHIEYGQLIPCFKLHNTLHVQLTLNTYYVKSYKVLSLGIREECSQAFKITDKKTQNISLLHHHRIDKIC